MPVADRKKLVDMNLTKPSITRQCGLLGLARSTYYHKPNPISEQDLQIMHTMDRMYHEDPTRGTRRYADDLAHEGYKVGRDKVRRLMQLMAIAAIYCKPRTTVADPAKYKYPYLLRGLHINRTNQVWKIDISYIPLRKGFLYLVAIIDVHSRYIVGWDISNTMEAEWVVGCVKQAVARHGAPEIINSDQGSQFTSDEYITYITSLKTVKISMDGKGRATDNAHIERFFRTIKHEKIYLHLPENGQELYALCSEFITFYNTKRSHSKIGKIPPVKRYLPAA
ncbi:IS3 family transposase [Natronogracilivirga saccharolytica]|uniref:IS3 family transposase n=1 Tax=Natronogracilivirga saccharolytica TaxID=2812953 RepID=UPI001FEBCBA0|nr:IS3 family transposase [Natronogracilivirga saccharolytica]